MKEIVPHRTKYSTGILIRICDKCWNEKLLNGEVYMRPLREFRMGNTPGFNDSEEGLVCKFDNVELLKNQKCFAKGRDFELYYGSDFPVFCSFEIQGHFMRENVISCIVPAQIITEFSAKCKEPTMVGFPKEPFLNRMDDFLTKQGEVASYKNVIYSDKPFGDFENPVRNIFRKRKTYEYQQEFRIVVEENYSEPKIANIGSLKDIGNIFPLKGWGDRDLPFEIELAGIE